MIFPPRANGFRWALAALVAAGFAGAPPVLSQNYDVTPLPFADNNSSIALNDNDVVVGEIANPDGSVSLGEWSQGALTNLGVPSGLPSTVSLLQPSGINDSGTIVGTLTTTAGSVLPFMYSAGSFTVLPLANPQDGAGIATAINSLGQIVGYDSGPTGTRAWVWSNGVYTMLPISGVEEVTAVGINSSGTIVGNRCCTNAAGYVLTGGTVQNLTGGVNAINNAGVAAGSNGFATIISNGTETPILNVTSTGFGINSVGDIVGAYVSPATELQQAYVWDPKTGAFDITPKGDNAALALAINDQGDILEFDSTPGGANQDFLLTPDANGALTPTALGGGSSPGPAGVPEPDTLLLFGLGLAAVVIAQRSTLARRHGDKVRARGQPPADFAALC
jgi:probable HAF family extracellular repeat protein